MSDNGTMKAAAEAMKVASRALPSMAELAAEAGYVGALTLPICANCDMPFTRRFPAERYCSNACAATGTVTFPAAAPIERPRTARTPRPAPDSPKPPDPPLAIVRMRRWVDEHPARA